MRQEEKTHAEGGDITTTSEVKLCTLNKEQPTTTSSQPAPDCPQTFTPPPAKGKPLTAKFEDTLSALAVLHEGPFPSKSDSEQGELSKEAKQQ